jgi:hypothetical protein
MAFYSILFEKPDDTIRKETADAPDCLADLFLDQVIDAITASRQEYDLKPFFYTSLSNVEAIKYRQEVMQDLEDKTLLESIKLFAQQMRSVRVHLALKEKLYYKRNQLGVFLDTVEMYCKAVNGLARELTRAKLRSRGLLALHDYVTLYIQSDRFTSLLAETETLRGDLSTVKYCVVIQGNRVQVRKYESEADYSVEVENTFEKFKQGAVKDYRVKLAADASMNHVEARILDLVAQLYPDVFASLDDYCLRHMEFLDETFTVFEREIQFYIAYLEHIAILKREGLKFCYPEISDGCKEVFDYEGFDLALAYKLFTKNSPVVCNDFYLKDKERVFVVSGPNQGGKTTFARTVGQLHYLASLGCPVPGSKAQLFLFDRIFTHFEKEEDIQNLHGKLQDDLIRIHQILEQATSNSIIIMNEIFTSTTLDDAVFLSKKIMEEIIQLDALCVYVTFIVELASLSEKTVSMVSTVAPENPAVRTFTIMRRPADGLSYAIAIAEKHQLTYEGIRERIKS